MEKLISCCGLNCAACDARIATLANNDALRAQTAEKWRVQHQAPHITADMINCTGCTQPGAKFGYCNLCKIRKCATAKGFGTCADCDRLDACQTVGALHQVVPDALLNLKSLN